MSTTAPARRTLALTTLAGALALAGCASTGTITVGAGPATGSPTVGGSAAASSGPASSGPDAAALRAAAAATVASGSARLTLDETVQGGGKSYTVKGTGSTELSSGGNGQLALDADGESIQLRVVGTVLYELLPPAARSAVPGGKPWVRIDTAKASAGSYGTVSAPDVSQSLGYLQYAQDVTTVGTETVDGTSTTHYRLQAALPKAGTGMLGVSLPTSIPIDVWVDAQQHIREERLVLTVSASGSGSSAASGSSGSASPSATAATQSVTSTTDLRMSDFGAPVTVTPPPAAQTADLTAAAASAAAAD
ncbi:hypothetical protein [Streptacidiphilus cavernicola]|uniref:LppX_LprAFG lipoprotein n=1 Tax=Streptacidiphilus cavernicola TaxID=3342716 RepID=A0ABV6VPD1_9ACTN